MLPEPFVHVCLTLVGRAAVPDISALGLVEAEHHNDSVLVCGEPDDDSDGDVWVERVGNALQVMSAGLTHTLERCALRLRLRRQVTQSVQKSSEVVQACHSDLIVG